MVPMKNSMMIFRRRLSDRIGIGDITLTVVAIHGPVITLGVDAPRGLDVRQLPPLLEPVPPRLRGRRRKAAKKREARAAAALKS
jgi:hypothetical protein